MDISCLSLSPTHIKYGLGNKIKIEKRKTPLEDAKVVPIKKKSSNPASLASKQIEFTIQARLIDNHTAAFHYQDTVEDSYLYKVLVTKKRKHMAYLENQNISNIDSIYVTPWNSTEFHFNIPQMFVGHNKSDQVCLLDNCINELCNMTLKVIHYDNECPKTRQRKIGIKILVSKIKIT